MIKLREYKSMISSVILTTFISLHCSWTFIRCSDDHTNEIGNQKEINNKNKIDHIINEMENNHTWTIFKIIITPGRSTRKKDNLLIQDIVSKEYINNENYFFNLFNRKHNALLLDEGAAQKIKETMGINNNENNNINNENFKINNAILKEENSKDNKKSTYYVLVKDITAKKYKNDHYTLFSRLETTAKDTNFTYTVEIFAANTTGVKDMGHMFASCQALTEIVGLEKWDTSNVTNMSYIFAWCPNLTNLHNISSWVTSSVKNMSCMFVSCRALTNLPDISGWDTSNVTDMKYMFCECVSLKSLPDISKWDTKKVTDMSFMFDCCESLTKLPDISKWNTKNVTDMNYMFYNCKELKFEKQDFKLIIPQQCIIKNIIDECDNLFLKDNCIQNKAS